MNLFITSQPLQLLCAIEAKNYFNCNNNILIILDCKTNAAKFNKILKNDKFTSIYRIKIDSEYKCNKYLNFLYIIYLIKFKFKDHIFNNIFTGSLALVPKLFILNICSLNYILIDDGAATLNISKKFNTLKHYYKSTLYKMLFNLFKLKYNVNSISFDMFTAFYEDKIEDNSFIKKVYKNDFTKIKEIQHNRLTENLNEVWFIGQPLSEHGTLISAEDEIKLLSYISYHYFNSGYQCFYIPHRFESSSKKSQIDLYTLFNVMEIDNLIEIYCLTSDKLPKIVCTFFSTAAITINKMFSNIDVQIYKIQDDLIADVDKRNSINKLQYKYNNLYNISYINI